MPGGIIPMGGGICKAQQRRGRIKADIRQIEKQHKQPS